MEEIRVTDPHFVVVSPDQFSVLKRHARLLTTTHEYTTGHCPCHGKYILKWEPRRLYAIADEGVVKNILYLEGAVDLNYFSYEMNRRRPSQGGEEHCTCCGEWRPCPCDQGKCPND